MSKPLPKGSTHVKRLLILISPLMLLLSLIFLGVNSDSPIAAYTNEDTELEAISTEELKQLLQEVPQSKFPNSNSNFFPPHLIYITLSDEKKPHLVYSHRVDEILAETQVKYSKSDLVSPNVQSIVGNGANIEIIYVEKVIEEVSSDISYATRKVESDEYELGTEHVVRSGILGVSTTSFELVYENGELVSRTKLGTEIKQTPQDQLIAVGTKIIPKTVTMENGEEFTYCSMKTMKVTAYDPSCAGCSNTTALGYTLKKGVIAVDPAKIPYHSVMYVPGYGVGTALDTGYSVKVENMIDVGFASAAERGANWSGTKYGHPVYISCTQ